MLNFDAAGTPQWGMAVIGQAVVQNACLTNDGILMAVVVAGNYKLLSASGEQGPFSSEYSLLLIHVKADGSSTEYKQFDVEEMDVTMIMAPTTEISVVAMELLDDGSVLMGGNLTGAITDGTSEIRSSVYDLWGMGDVPHNIAYVVKYSVESQLFDVLDTIRPRTMAGEAQFLSMTHKGDEIYVAVRTKDVVSSADRQFVVPIDAADNALNGLLLSKYDATGSVWDKLTVVNGIPKMASNQPYCKPTAMVVDGDRLLMAGVFNGAVDFGDGVKIDTLGKSDSTDYFVAVVSGEYGKYEQAVVFGNVDAPEERLLGMGSGVEHLQMVSDGTNAYIMGSFYGTLKTPVGDMVSDSIDNFVLRYTINENEWAGAKFGGPSADYASSISLYGNRLLVAGLFNTECDFFGQIETGQSDVYNSFYALIDVEAFYSIDLPSVSNGSLLTSPLSRCPAGRTVTIIPTPNTGFRLVEGSLKVYKTGFPSDEVEITNNTFVMPAYDVTIEGQFEEMESTPSGLRDNKYAPLTLFPNPTKGAVQVQAPELVEGTAAEVLVYNATGQLVLRIPSQGASAGSAASRISIDLNSYPSGLYIIRAGNAVAKVLKM